MKLACKVNKKDALIVGYAQGKGGKILAIVITCGELRSVRLKDVELINIPEGLEKTVIPLKERKHK